MLSDQDLFSVRQGVEDMGHELEALKRYSDFESLHKTLLRSPLLPKHLKGLHQYIGCMYRVVHTSTCIVMYMYIHVCT